MDYNDDFYKAYEKYLFEPKVRQSHDWMFSLFKDQTQKYNNVIDIGCGQSNEFDRFYNPCHYTGIDVNVELKHRNNGGAFVKGNYRDRNFLDTALHFDETSSLADAFVSLFSVEITAPTYENYKLYNYIFERCPAIQSGLVSGFYYTDKMKHNPITEAGGIISFQTLDLMEAFEGFEERRIMLPVPSKMFGSNVVEVWKIFNRI